MIKNFRHKGLQDFYETGGKAGIRPEHATKLRRLLARLEVAHSDANMNLPGWKWHALRGKQKGHFAVRVNGNWRLIFMFENGDAALVDYQDYH